MRLFSRLKFHLTPRTKIVILSAGILAAMLVAVERSIAQSLNLLNEALDWDDSDDDENLAGRHERATRSYLDLGQDGGRLHSPVVLKAGRCC